MVAAPDLKQLQFFAGPEHEPFLWTGNGEMAALLVHGFPGTPAETRPLATHLHHLGWTTKGLLLPGFGRQIASLGNHTADDWVHATRVALADLRADYRQVVLIGYSMGGAVALTAATGQPPDALVLVAPFWRLGNRVQGALMPLIARFFPTFRPFRRAQFHDPRVRRSIHHFLPNLDLQSPHVQKAVRALEVETSILRQVRAVGREAIRKAPALTASTLVVQGSLDAISHPQHTVRLVKRMPPSTQFCSIEADHNLLMASHPAFSQVAATVAGFLDSVRNNDQEAWLGESHA